MADVLPLRGGRSVLCHRNRGVAGPGPVRDVGKGDYIFPGGNAAHCMARLVLFPFKDPAGLLGTVDLYGNGARVADVLFVHGSRFILRHSNGFFARTGPLRNLPEGDFVLTRGKVFYHPSALVFFPFKNPLSPCRPLHLDGKSPQLADILSVNRDCVPFCHGKLSIGGFIPSRHVGKGNCIFAVGNVRQGMAAVERFAPEEPLGLPGALNCYSQLYSFLFRG